MHIENINWATRKILCHTLIEKYQKGNEYAYKIYELDTISCLLKIDECESTPNFGMVESLVLWN
jgi:hypothetical protein